MKRARRNNSKKALQSRRLQDISENDFIDIKQYLVSDSLQSSDLISKLEDHSSLSSFVIFYLKALGLDWIAHQLEGQQVDQVKFDEYLQKLEKLQNESDESLLNEDACRLITEKGGDPKVFQENLNLFFSTLFSGMTDLPYQLEGFFQVTFQCLSQVTQTRFRMVRIAGIEFIGIMVHHILEFVKDNEDQKFEKDCLKFLNNLLEYLITQRSHDVLSLIKKKVVQIAFMAFGLPQFSGDPYYKHLAELFISEHYECREAALQELERQSNALHFFKAEQENVISLIFDQNESIQIRLIQFLKSQVLTRGNQQLMTRNCRQALVRQLFCHNQRIRYEVAQIIPLIENTLSADIKQLGQYLENHIKFFVTNCPEEHLEFSHCFHYLFSFMPNTILLNPNAYLEHIIQDRDQERRRIALLFYASAMEFQTTLTANAKHYWWIEMDEDMIEKARATVSNFTQAFLERASSINITNVEYPATLYAFLQVYQRIAFQKFESISLRPKLNVLLESLFKSFQMAQDAEILDLIAKVLAKALIDLPTNESIRQQINLMTGYLKNALEKKQFAQALLLRTESFLKNNLALWDPNFIEFDAILQMEKQFTANGKTEQALDILRLFSTALQNTLRQVLKNLRSSNYNEFENNYQTAKEFFYRSAFKFISNDQQFDDLHFLAAKLVLNNLIYTNNTSIYKLGLHFKINPNHLELLYQITSKCLADVQRGSSKEDSHGKSSTKQKFKLDIENLPQLSQFHLELVQHIVTLLTTSQNILITAQFGVPMVCEFIHISLSNVVFRDFQQLMKNLSDSIAKIIDIDHVYKRQDFWQFVSDYVLQVNSNPKWDTEEHLVAFSKMIVKTFLNSVTKVNVKEKRQAFIAYCAQSIERAYNEKSFSPFLSLLNQFFNYPKKLIKTLQIDKLTYKKFSAFFEMNSKQFHQQDHPSEYKVLIEKRESNLRQRLRLQTGLSDGELEKIIKDQGVKQSAAKSEIEGGMDEENLVKRQKK